MFFWIFFFSFALNFFPPFFRTLLLLDLVVFLIMPKIVSKSYSSHVLETTPVKQKQRRPQESTSVILAKDLLKVKLENFYNSRVSELGELCVPWFVRVLGFYSSMGLIFVPWLRGFFLVGEILFNSHILWDPFLIGLS